MSKSKFSALRKHLPHQYAKLIAAKLDGVTNVQVGLVFRDQITDPEKIEKILRAARQVIAQLNKNKQLASNRTRKKKATTVKPTV